MRYPPFGHPGATHALAWRVAAVTRHRAPTFADFASGAAVAAELALMQASGLWDILAWVLLPWRLEALVALRRGNLEDAAAGLLARAALRVMQVRDLGGPVWELRYTWRPVHGDAEIAAAARELLRQPLRAQLTERLADYPFWDSCWVCAGTRTVVPASIRRPAALPEPTPSGQSAVLSEPLPAPPAPGLPAPPLLPAAAELR